MLVILVASTQKICAYYTNESVISITLISLPDLSFPPYMSSLKLSTILMVIFGPKSETSNAWIKQK